MKTVECFNLNCTFEEALMLLSLLFYPIKKGVAEVKDFRSINILISV